MFDVTVQVGHAEIDPLEDHLRLSYHLVTLLPVPVGMGPDGQPQFMQIPVTSGIIRILMGKDAAKKHGQELVDGAEGIDDPEPQQPQAQSDLVLAKNLNGVDKLAEQNEKFRGK